VVQEKPDPKWRSPLAPLDFDPATIDGRLDGWILVPGVNTVLLRPRFKRHAEMPMLRTSAETVGGRMMDKRLRSLRPLVHRPTRILMAEPTSPPLQKAA